MLASTTSCRRPTARPSRSPPRTWSGLYYSPRRARHQGEGKKFASVEDVLIALEMGEVETLTPIKLRFTGRVIDLGKPSTTRT